MPATFTKFSDAAAEAKRIANLARLFFHRSNRLLSFHASNGFSTAGDATKPAYVNEDANGNIDGFDYDRFGYAGLVNCLVQLKTFAEGGVPAAGAYADVVNVVADADPA